MVAGVGATDGWGVHPRLPSRGKVVHTTEPAGPGVVTSHRLEVQPELTHIRAHLVDSVGAGAGAGGGVGARVVWVPDVGRVGGDDGAAGRGVDHAADAEPRGTVPIRAPALGRALRAGVARPVGRAGAGSGALLVGELDDGEQGKCLCRSRSCKIIRHGVKTYFQLSRLPRGC